MSDLIERQATIEAVGLNTWAGSRISQLPTVDAVEVVRCKDCKYLDIINKAPVYTYCSKHNHIFPLWEEDTREHFCSWGERREDE